MTILSIFGSESPVSVTDEESNHGDDEERPNTPEDQNDDFVHVETTTQPADANSVMSLEDHNVVVGFPPGTLVDLMRGEEEVSSCGGTILSSAASGVVMEPSPGSESVWAISPHPRMAVGSALSISTTETVYRDVSVVAMDDDTSHVTCEQESVSDERNRLESTTYLSVNPSSMDSSDLDDWSNYSSINCDSSSDRNKQSVCHDRSSFVNVGNRLSSVPEDRACRWYANFNDEDWEQFRQAADAVMEAMGPPRPSQVLPPQAPTVRPPESTNYVASQLLPEALVCPICHDAIVGATTLSCGCTVCSPCWEHHVATTVTQCEEKEKKDESCPESVVCPSCQESVDRSIPCHSLDVAILGAIQNASPTSPETKQLQQAYYHRLNQWRSEIQRRLDQWSKEQAPYREKILAQCIQREEELLWKQSAQKVGFLQTRGWAFISEVAILLLAASVGIKLTSMGRR